jgi:hypothetical protein
MPIRVNLSNAVEITDEYPQRVSDYPPNFQQIDQLTPDDYAKLKSKGEYFWVKVDEVDDYVGIVQDEPVFSQQFKQGDRIYFEDFNIYDIRSKWWLNNERI